MGSKRGGIEGVPAVAPATVPAEAMLLPEELDVRFEGFCDEAFQILEALRRRPHIEEYRKEKARIRSLLQEPFKRYRDDLVVNWVLPNRLDLETERNVFSRLLKNDFGAGGCHHHMWMSFYRTGRRRLQDVQLAHSLWPEGMYVVGYVGKPVPQIFKRVQRRIMSGPDEFLDLVNPLLQFKNTTLQLTYRKTRTSLVAEDPIDRLPDDFGRAEELAVRVAISRREIVDRGPMLIPAALDAVLALWPFYKYCLESSSTA